MSKMDRIHLVVVLVVALVEWDRQRVGSDRTCWKSAGDFGTDESAIVPSTDVTVVVPSRVLHSRIYRLDRSYRTHRCSSHFEWASWTLLSLGWGCLL